VCRGNDVYLKKNNCLFIFVALWLRRGGGARIHPQHSMPVVRGDKNEPNNGQQHFFVSRFIYT